MKRPFGDKNAVRLFTVWGVNALAFAWAFLGLYPFGSDWDSLYLVPLVIAIAAVLNGLIDPVSKERMVFFHWKYPFPAARAFSVSKLERSKDSDSSSDRVDGFESKKWQASEEQKGLTLGSQDDSSNRSIKLQSLTRNDGRIDENKLLKRERGSYPNEPERQYAVWFKYYIEVQDNPSVLYRRRDYMFARDYACTATLIFALTLIAFFMQHFSYVELVISGVLSLLGVPYFGDFNVPTPYFVFTMVQYLGVLFFAIRQGRHFMTTVLAVGSVAPDPATPDPTPPVSVSEA